MISFVPNKNDAELYNVEILNDNKFKSCDCLTDPNGVCHSANCNANFGQYDGADDIPGPLPTIPAPVKGKPHRSLSVPNIPSTNTVNQAPFRLNEKKQVSKLKRDARLPDFDITVSPTEQSVSVVCSTGSYTLVVIPALSTISVGSRINVDNVALYCNDIVGKVDDVGAAVNAVIHFRFSTSDQASTGSIVVHLHHTARKVQVQGSAMVNNKIRASVWFVQHCLLKQFTAIARDKAFDISKFNDDVTKMVDKHIDKLNAREKCDVCLGLFNGRSIQERCQGCHKITHKGCATDHSCNATLSATSAPIPRPPLSSPATPAMSSLILPSILSTKPPELSSTAVSSVVATVVSPVRPQSLINSGQSTTMPCSPLSGPTAIRPSLSATGPPGTSAPSYPIASSSSHPPTPGEGTQATQLRPSAQSFVPNEPPAGLKRSGKGKNKDKTGIATSTDGIDLEFAKITINTIRTKLADREKQVKDLEFQNSILLERVSAFEKSEKQAIYEKYFPKSACNEPSSMTSHAQTMPEHSPMSCRSVCCHRSCHHCCPPPPLCQPQGPTLSGALDGILAKVAKSVELIRKDVECISGKVAVLETALLENDKECRQINVDKESIQITENEIRIMQTPDKQVGNISDTNDDSVMTVDECVPQLDTLEDDLNSQDLTTQLLQLRH